MNRTAFAPLVVVRAPRRYGLRPAALRRTVELTLEYAPMRVAGEIGVAIIDDDEMRLLNRRYLNKDAPTDVLSFPLDGHACAGEPFGDIAISYDTARRQAQAYGATLAREIDRLLVHGVLHLCGYSHDRPREAARMHGIAKRVMRKLAQRA
ncbi:MAG: rRNA maturation RNase YbeY [Candidatus Eremiobacter antarcticus]|nr:rRNA maturation RNase YbeY [Candidatus Eremiobacteraeota bacterium]MBC5809201.1 rRNA maturation RNase YbeY [Candidatus Eremiobacteraeota bacterium]